MAAYLLFSTLWLSIHLVSKIQSVESRRPSFIFILADDQDYVFNSMSVMPNTLKYLADEGLTFNNAFIATPICCPSRTETITGRVFQNIKKENSNTCMRIAAQYNVINNSQSMFQIFHQNGYNTGSFGKLTNDMANFFCSDNPYLNGFSRVNAPCHFNDFYGLQYMDYDESTNNRTLYNITLDENAYETSFVGNASLDWISSQLAQQNSSQDANPFIAWIGPHSPHCPATPAAWYVDKFNDEKAPRTATYNAHLPNHNDFLSTNPAMDFNVTEWVDQLYRNRLRSLLSIDDIVREIINELEKYPALNENTYIVYTSDHGYHLGQLRVPCNKMLPYDTDIRIPMYIRGPNIPRGTVSNRMVGNIDILPTFLSLAGIEYSESDYDGISWTEFLINDNESQDWRQLYMSQYQSIGTLTSHTDCSSWYPSADGSVVPGQAVRSEACNAYNQPWYIDKNSTNNWRLLRTINETDDWMYVEFIANDWEQSAFENPHFYEFYNVSNDPFQIDNLYSSLDESLKKELHSLIMKYGSCKGANCR